MSAARARMLAYYGVPLLFCLAVHWLAFKTWFYSDDFAWLGLHQQVHSPKDLISVLFSPQAQGTVRVFSERLFFLVFSTLFGLQSAPFRIWVFLTQFANIILLSKIAQRLTGSATAGFVAPILWTASVGLSLAITWTSAYNEIAFALILLLAFYLLLRYIETGQRKFWIWQWVVFLLGFGVLELTVVYPALAAGYALCCARPYFRKCLLLFIPSLLFTIAHFVFVPPPTDPYYQMFFGPSLFTTLWTYWLYAFAGARDAPVDWRPLWLGISFTIAATAILLAFAIRKLRGRDWLPLFLIAWFFIVIAPILPLKNHFTEYYITGPVIGLSILAAWAFAQARGAWKIVAASLAALYLVLSITETRVAEKYFYDRSRRIKYLMKGLAALPAADKNKTLLFSDVDSEFFWLSFYGDPFRLIGYTKVYLMPGSEKAIDPHPEWGGISRFIISRDEARKLLQSNQAVALELQGHTLLDVTGACLADPTSCYGAQHPLSIDVGNPKFQSLLGPSWYPSEGAFRWMPKSATLTMGGPHAAGQMLEVTGFAPAALVAKGPLTITFSANGTKLGSAELSKPDEPLKAQFPLPAQLVGQESIEIQIEVSRTVKVPPDPRELGMVFQNFAIK